MVAKGRRGIAPRERSMQLVTQVLVLHALTVVVLPRTCPPGHLPPSGFIGPLEASITHVPLHRIPKAARDASRHKAATNNPTRRPVPREGGAISVCGPTAAESSQLRDYVARPRERGARAEDPVGRQ